MASSVVTVAFRGAEARHVDAEVRFTRGEARFILAAEALSYWRRPAPIPA